MNPSCSFTCERRQASGVEGRLSMMVVSIFGEAHQVIEIHVGILVRVGRTDVRVDEESQVDLAERALPVVPDLVVDADHVLGAARGPGEAPLLHAEEERNMLVEELGRDLAVVGVLRRIHLLRDRLEVLIDPAVAVVVLAVPEVLVDVPAVGGGNGIPVIVGGGRVAGG